MYLSKNTSIALKGIAIMFVLLGHRGYLDCSGAWGVHIFLIVSGYGLFISGETVRKLDQSGDY